MNLSYPILNSGQSLVFTREVYNKLFSYSQTDENSKEAGGQIFATITKHEVLIKVVTGPRKKDRRSRFSFIPDRVAEQFEIIKCHLKGLNYIGDWHTHPQKIPTPSPTDLESMQDCYQKSKHELQWFIMVIVGMKKSPESLYVAVLNKEEHHQLSNSVCSTPI